MSITVSLYDHGKHFTVTSEPVGLLKKSSASDGIRAAASGNTLLKKSVTSFLVPSVAKEGFPLKGKNNVQVKLPSRLGNAINIYPPRGHICNAFFSSRNAAPGPAS